MKKLPKRSQKSRERIDSKRAASAALAGLRLLRRGGSATPGSPRRLSPRSAGWLRIRAPTRGMARRPTPATARDAVRQPWVSTMAARSGRKRSWPVALLAVSMPMASPRRWVNQRLTTVAPSATAVMPVPPPTTTPQSSTSCHGAVISVVKATPAATVARAMIMVSRAPRYSTRAAAKGPMRPKRIRLIETAREMVAAVQPNSCSRGTISTPGVARVAAAGRSGPRVGWKWLVMLRTVLYHVNVWQPCGGERHEPERSRRPAARWGEAGRGRHRPGAHPRDGPRAVLSRGHPRHRRGYHRGALRRRQDEPLSQLRLEG